MTWWTIYDTATGRLVGHTSVGPPVLLPEWTVVSHATRQDQDNTWNQAGRSWMPRVAPPSQIRARTVNMVEDYGCDPTDIADNRAKIQKAYDDHKGMVGGTVLYFPPGIYAVDGTLRFGMPIDFDAKITICGAGRRGVELRQRNPAATTFDMRNAGQNLRGIVVSDLTLRWGAIQLWLGAAAYNLFRNVTFWAGGQTGVRSVEIGDGSNNNHFDSCWWVHGDQTGDCMAISAGQATFSGCVFGEDIGNIWLGDSGTFVNCKFQYGEDRAAANGHQNMGRAMFTVPNDGTAKFLGCTMWVVTNMMNLDNANRVIVDGCEIRMGTGAVLKNRNADLGHPFQFTNNSVSWGSSGAFYSTRLAGGGEHPQNSVFTGNSFDVAPTFTVTSDDSLLKPEMRNVWRDNTYRVGVI